MSVSKILTTLAVTLTALAPAQAAPVHGQGTWETTLQARDLDGNGVTDAFYDTKLNITWLRNTNVNGLMNWSTANTWANNLTFGGYSDWRLPTMVDTGTHGCNLSYVGGTDCGYNVQTTSGSTVYSEMASLWYDTLGNKAYYTPGTGVPQAGSGLTNTGDFLYMHASSYWSGLEYSPNTNIAWYFYTYEGRQNALSQDGQFYALAVRPGDVAAATVPEPESLLLALTALAGLGLMRRQGRKSV